MWLEILRGFLFVAHHLGRCVEILLAAIVAPRVEPRVNRRTRHDGIRYTERNPVPVKQVLPKVVEMVLAEYDPAVL